MRLIFIMQRLPYNASKAFRAQEKIIESRDDTIAEPRMIGGRNPGLRHGPIVKERSMDLIEAAKQLFGNEARPAHFTDHRHCAECAEHDETLRISTPELLQFSEIRPGWDPLCFVTPEGFRYYFPALVRLAIEGTGPTYFVDRLLFHLELDGRNNLRFQAFTPEQRAYVVSLLFYLVEIHAAEIEDNLDTENLFRTISIWEHGDDA